MMTLPARQPIPVVVHQHAEESAMLRHVRSVLVRAPHVKLHHLRRLDDRIAAHLDGLSVAGSYGTRICTEALERPGAGETFAAAVRAIDERDGKALDRLIALGGAVPEAMRGLLSAFGWVSATDLQGIVRSLLASGDPRRRELGVAACRLHQADPGPMLASMLGDADSALRAAALRTAAELGRLDLIEPVRAAIGDDTEPCTFWAAWSACLLGDRDHALRTLAAIGRREGEFRDLAEQMLLLAVELSEGREIVRTMSKASLPEPVSKRRVIRACALSGDAEFVPWLIELMADDGLARLAGESFSTLTGADLAALDLERKPPEGVRNGPSDDPDDDDVSLDEDESLPWPDRELVLGWWRRHAGQMPANERCFLAAPPTAAHCTHALREGFQRQRIVAARLLCLRAPGTPHFPVCAPAWRQQRRFPRE